MNYTYNVTVNFNENLINFYEWNKDDNIKKLNKTLVYLVDLKTYKDIINKNVKVTQSFLDNLLTTDYTCIFTTEVDAICVKFDKDGYIKLLSKLLLLEERDILDDLTPKNQIILKYKKLSNKQVGYSRYTRYEKQNIEKILNFLNKEKDNTSLINYMYYEWFDTTKSNDKYNDLSTVVTQSYCEKHDKLLKVIDLFNCNNV